MIPREKIIITSGTYDPLTLEDISFLRECKKRGDWLVVGVHSDWWMCFVEGGFVQSFNSRSQIVESLSVVDEVFKFNDTDGTVCQLLKLVKICYPNTQITYLSKDDMTGQPEAKIRGITFETLK
jgi:hypothetical protein